MDMHMDMDMDMDMDTLPPLATINRHRRPTRTRTRTPPILDPVFLIILVPILALIFLFFFLPPLLSHTSHILKPASVKSRLNIFLVLFAILCGVMAPKNDDDNGFAVESVQSSGQWVEFSDNITSYNNTSRRIITRELSGESEEEEEEIKEIAVVVTSTTNAPLAKTPPPPPPSPPPPPPPPPPPSCNSKVKVPTNTGSDDFDKVIPLPPPPPPPPPAEFGVHHKRKSLERKVSDATKEIATAITSLYNYQSKRKNKRKLRNTSPEIEEPRPSSIFNNIFKSGGKSKRFHLPPPRYKSKEYLSKPQIRRSKSKGKPPLPASSYYERERMPPQPPPPPFKISDMTFEVRGDYVTIRSSHSSPDHNLSSTVMHGGDPASDSGFGLICFPSPDVNAKADSFISRLKDEWRMEKLNY